MALSVAHNMILQVTLEDGIKHLKPSIEHSINKKAAQAVYL